MDVSIMVIEDLRDLLGVRLNLCSGPKTTCSGTAKRKIYPTKTLSFFLLV